MSQLIALVATAVVVDGKRTLVQPGQPLPETLSAHDAQALKAAGVAQDPAAQAASASQDERAVRVAEADFAAARQRVLDEQAGAAAARPKGGAAKK